MLCDRTMTDPHKPTDIPALLTTEPCSVLQSSLFTGSSALPLFWLNAFCHHAAKALTSTAHVQARYCHKRNQYFTSGGATAAEI